jgi:hypothetical protein
MSIKSRRRWVWIGAGLVLAAGLLWMGAIIAANVGIDFKLP